jgi:hypothetical protein
MQEARTKAEERMQILNMVREGKITAGEGARRLEALRGSGAGAAEAEGCGNPLGRCRPHAATLSYS